MIEKGRIHSIETFGSVDGPGIRFVVFMQGCHMRCQYCHNPDTWNMNAKNAKWMSSEELLKQALRYQSYWKHGGGITVSGGEPLLQIDFVLDFFRKAKAYDVHTCLDTSGNPFTRREPFFQKFQELMKVTDLILLDLKEINDVRHRILTGHTNSNILDMARCLCELKKPIWIRHVLVPERSDYEEDLRELRRFLDTLDQVERVEILPYHTMGTYKWTEMGMQYPLNGILPPSKERIKRAEEILRA